MFSFVLMVNGRIQYRCVNGAFSDQMNKPVGLATINLKPDTSHCNGYTGTSAFSCPYPIMQLKVKRGKGDMISVILILVWLLGPDG